MEQTGKQARPAGDRPGGMFDLTGRVVLVTGAAGLLGREHARALARYGATVVAADLDGEAAAEVAASLREEFDPPAQGLRLDVSDADSLGGAAARILQLCGRLDVLINNAACNDKVEGRTGPAAGRPEEYPMRLWRETLEVNVTGLFLCCRVFGGLMATRGGGSVVNVASTYGLVAPDQSLYRDPEGRQQMYKNPAYPASKGAVLSLTRYLAAFWGAAGVRVNALTPGGVEDGQPEWFRENYERRTPLGRMARATDYHGAVVFLASDASAYMTGANLVVDGGWTAW